MLRRLPKLAVAVTAFSLVVITVVFSILDAWLWKPLPLPRAEELVIAFGATKARPAEPQVFLFARVLEAWRARGRTIQSAGGVMRTGFEIETAEGREPVSAMHVTPELMRTLHPSLPAREPGAVFVSEALWRRYFSHAPQSIALSGRSHPVAAVLPRDFDFRVLDQDKPVDLYVVHDFGDGVASTAIVARTKPGVSIDEARAELAAIFASVEGAHTDNLREYLPLLVSLQADNTRSVRRTLLLLGAAALGLLAIAVANVGALLLSRNMARAREFAIREALGATRGHILRQLVCESFIISAVAAVIALPLTYGAIRLIAAKMPFAMAPPSPILFDARAFAATVLAAMLVALPRVRVPQTVLLGLQVAVTSALLITTTALAETVVRLERTPLGFQPLQLYSFTAREPLALAELRAMPGVVSAAAGTMPLLSAGPNDDVQTRGMTKPARLSHQQVSGDFFSTLQLPLLRGRGFGAQDNEPVAVINEKAALSLGGVPEQIRVGKGPWRRVTGVVGNAGSSFYNTIEWQTYPIVYTPLEKQAGVYYFVRSRGAMPPQSIPANGRIREFRSAAETIRTATRQPALRALVLALFSLAGLLLAGAGMFAIVSQNVNLRLREIGIRLALGAPTRAIRSVVARRTALACGTGFAVGCAASVAAARWLAEILYGVQTASPVTFGAAAAAVLVCTWLATAPAIRRAQKVDPASIIRLNGDSRL